jgi:hypothetical protein
MIGVTQHLDVQTFNVRRRHPTGERISVQRPGNSVLATRQRLSASAVEEKER